MDNLELPVYLSMFWTVPGSQNSQAQSRTRTGDLLVAGQVLTTNPLHSPCLSVCLSVRPFIHTHTHTHICIHTCFCISFSAGFTYQQHINTHIPTCQVWTSKGKWAVYIHKTCNEPMGHRTCEHAYMLHIRVTWAHKHRCTHALLTHAHRQTQTHTEGGNPIWLPHTPATLQHGRWKCGSHCGLGYNVKSKMELYSGQKVNNHFPKGLANSPKLHENMFTHSLRVICIHADSFGLICRDFEIAVSRLLPLLPIQLYTVTNCFFVMLYKSSASICH